MPSPGRGIQIKCIDYFNKPEHCPSGDRCVLKELILQLLKATFGVTAMLMAASAPLWANSEEKFTNSKVHVVEYAVAPGDRVALPPEHPSVVVVISGDRAELGFAGKSKLMTEFKRGMTAAESAGWNSLANTGSTPIDLVRIEFLTNGLDETWGMVGLSPNYKMLVEDRYNRSYDIRIPSHTFEPQHTHHDRVVVCLDGATLEHIMPDGSKEPSTLRVGEVGWRKGGTHIGHNLGTTDLWVIAVEPK